MDQSAISINDMFTNNAQPWNSLNCQGNPLQFTKSPLSCSQSKSISELNTHISNTHHLPFYLIGRASVCSVCVSAGSQWNLSPSWPSGQRGLGVMLPITLAMGHHNPEVTVRLRTVLPPTPNRGWTVLIWLLEAADWWLIMANKWRRSRFYIGKLDCVSVTDFPLSPE